MSFDVDMGYTSLRGPRAVNEDFGGLVQAPARERQRGLVAAVADGVSTGGGGLLAAQTTVMSVLGDFFSTPELWEPTVVLDRLVGAQNAWLAQHNRTAGPTQGTALTTLTALALQGQTWTLAHVGDSRAWLLRPGPQGQEMSLLTQDHAFDDPNQRSRLTRAVGLDDGLRLDFRQGDVRVGDCFVLSTDGVHGPLKAERMAQLASAPGSAQQAAEAIAQAALDAGGQDNATVLLLRVTGLDARALGDELGDSRRLAPPPLLKVGEVIDGYQITAVVADTQVHRLYQARDQRDGALVAIKALHPSRASDPEERALLAHEAWLGQRLGDAADAGFVRVHPRRPEATCFYVVFDWHGGQTLAQRMASGERPGVVDVVGAALAVSQALGRLHRLGVVHRDVKPDNLHLGDDGRWRLLDLGVATSARTSAAQRALHAGTPSYMNPEQWQGAPADAGSDLFALGVTLYQWLTGRLPYGDIEPYQTGRYKRDPLPVTRLRPDVPIWLDHLLGKAVAPRLGDRFETAEELQLALERGALRPVSAPAATPLIRRDGTVLLKAGLAVSLLFNLLLVIWLLFLPR